ncbi:ABC transporter ATP-binding protein [Rhizobium binae]|uniref:ABC transporter ATP-binding protein n=1 Tax=Rhizobium binae TaxID=1138190 RepID=UPI001C82AA3E|nr:ABC transporter ATP-binding protein [Rhizobium binae]MBX4935962.1 ABC transporter ATP-binding protein [Rhizobium binae]MBX4942001.1 ABC transporter ATP-binding protein [Rhizobium binae]MBX4961969.1 ABC transporter ATP-binding protein [Rhizobium binae]MBX4977891.1 ABC transporter ATP-binding protein [Rhizobium binae]
MLSPLLSLRGISKSYGQVQANQQIDLDVAPCSIHAILGENGAGKSTLMKLIYGVEQPDSGTVAWNGKALSLASPAEARRAGIGMVFQHFSLFESLTVVENIRLIVSGKKSELAERIRKLGHEFSLEVDPHAHVHSLSVGERQRVEIIRCLMTDPKLLILDEPTSVLPPQAVEKLFETLRRLRDGGVSILFISHKLGEIQSLCDRATILRGGRVTGHVDPREHDAHELARMMIGRDMPEPMPPLALAEGEKRLELIGLEYRVDPLAVPLFDVSLTVRAGEILGIAGISGNGQSELAELISGETVLPRDQRDQIFMMGRDVGGLDAAARRRLGFAFVPEDRLGRGAVPEMSLALNSLLTAHPFDLVRHGLLDKNRAKSFTNECIRDYDVRTPGPEAEAGSLSGGNLQKFIVGREIMLAPKLLFLAQPTWGVDIGAAAAIRQRLISLRNEGMAILIISEELEELFELCDFIQVLHHGTLSPPLVTRDTEPEEIGRYMIGAQPQREKAPA